MTSRAERLLKRLEGLEAARASEGGVELLFVPAGLSGAARDAWIAQEKAKLPLGVEAIAIEFVGKSTPSITVGDITVTFT